MQNSEYQMSIAKKLTEELKKICQLLKKSKLNLRMKF